MNIVNMNELNGNEVFHLLLEDYARWSFLLDMAHLNDLGMMLAP